MSQRNTRTRSEPGSRLRPNGEAEFDPLGGTEGGDGTRRNTPRNGVKALMLAILEDGIRSYLNGSPRIHREAECWMMARAPHSPFAFTVVCETLGFEPDAVVRALRKMRSTDPSARRAIRRSRPNVRRTTSLTMRKAE